MTPVLTGGMGEVGGIFYVRGGLFFLIATGSIEELVHKLKERVTILIVTHNMQQAARVSDYTAYMYIGELVEFGPTKQLFTQPSKKQTEDYITGRFG